ncbi:hypothetical protein WKI68_00165 [Streptomyces sp. MS1.HAVA.3]|uniref:Helix-turn-helix domain-containing protein n=1 Tax=Streptomyces caledonius TaxID=3134107 RepID=A0ABU8TXB1_9ACTN
MLVTQVHLRTGLPHTVLAELYGTARFTIFRAIGEIRPLQAARGFVVPDRPGLRLRTLGDLFAYAEAEGITLRIDAAETQVRRPKANRPGRRLSPPARRSRAPSRPPPSATDRAACRGLADDLPSRSAPRRRSRSRMARSASSMPGVSSADGTPRLGFVSSTPTPNCGSGARSSATPADARTTPKPTARSPRWSPTAPARRATRRKQPPST